MGKYSTKSVTTSKRAYEVLKKLLEKKESYATEISKELDMDRSMASEILSKLEELSIIKVSKREQAKYYKINPEGLFKQFDDYWKVFDHDNRTAKMKVRKEKFPGDQEKVEQQYNSKMPIFLTLYVYHYTKHFDDSNIEKMLKDDFFEMARDFSEAKQVLGEGYFEWLRNVLNRIFLLEVLNKDDSLFVLKSAVSNYGEIMENLDDEEDINNTKDILDKIKKLKD